MTGPLAIARGLTESITRCCVDGCETVLSQYGNGRHCARHEPQWDYLDDMPLDEYTPTFLDGFPRGCMGSRQPPTPDGVCSRCGTTFSLRKDGTVRWHKSGLPRTWPTGRTEAA